MERPSKRSRLQEQVLLVTAFVALVVVAVITALDVLVVPIDQFRAHEVLDVGEFVLIVIAAVTIFAARGMHAAAERRVTEALLAAATTDDLTGLANRRAFIAAAEREIARSRRYGRPFALLLWDLNDLKHVNDRRGHLAGDAALKLFAGALRSSMRLTDVAARLGGDEFAMILPEGSIAGAEALQVRVKADVDWAASGLSAACGASIYPDDGQTFDELFAASDSRMYDHKRRAARPPGRDEAPVGIEAPAPRPISPPGHPPDPGNHLAGPGAA